MYRRIASSIAACTVECPSVFIAAFNSRLTGFASLTVSLYWFPAAVFLAAFSAPKTAFSISAALGQSITPVCSVLCARDSAAGLCFGNSS